MHFLIYNSLQTGYYFCYACQKLITKTPQDIAKQQARKIEISGWIDMLTMHFATV